MESQGHYNAWYRQADQNTVDLATLTLQEVRALQQRLRAEGHDGSAIGRYQFLPDTLDRLITQQGLTGKERFTPALQD